MKHEVTDEEIERHHTDTLNHLPCLTTQEILDELVKRDGVKKINLKMTCQQDFIGYDTCIVVRQP